MSRAVCPGDAESVGRIVRDEANHDTEDEPSQREWQREQRQLKQDEHPGWEVSDLFTATDDVEQLENTHHHARAIPTAKLLTSPP